MIFQDTKKNRDRDKRPISSIRDRAWQLWLIASIVLTIIYGLLGLKKAFSGEWIVQDDARQHVFWMLRYIDKDLFPNDLIANYFQSVAPVGYKIIYWLPAKIGISPLILNKLLPIILGIITTYYFFNLCRQIFPVPLGCFISTLLLNQTLWLKDDIISGTPRAFVYPIFIAFLYYFVRRSLIATCICIFLLGIFYPQGVFLASGMLLIQLIKWQGIKPTLSQNKKDYIYCFAGLGIAFLVLLPFALHSSEFAPTITRSQALQLQDFQPQGRSKFFKENLLGYIFGGGRAGLFPKSLYTPATLVFGFFLPVIIRFPRTYPLVTKIFAKIAVLPQLLIVSVGMFLLAHAVLFKLHLPSRYTGHSFRIIIALAAGITITAILDTLWKKFQQKNTQKKKLIIPKITTIACISFLALALIAYPAFVNTFPNTKYKTGKIPELYTFLQQQPKDIIIASLTSETDNIPTFARRSILVSREYAIPYHLGYYLPYRQRARDLIKAQYSPDLEIIKQFIRQYNISFWLIEESSFTPEYIANNSWIAQHQVEVEDAILSLKAQNIPTLTNYKNKCSVFDRSGYTLIDTSCILDKS